MATSNAGNTVAAINAAAAAISSVNPRYLAPQRRRWKDSWARYWCFGWQKRDKRIVPTSRGDGGSASGRGWTAIGPAQALAPPSSPASFVNSSVHSPVSFALPLSAASTGMCSPGRTNTMFTIGPYAHETQLVSPPVFSTFTTEPSTAPFTPPPELAHLTTPSSPDVPFAQLIASSLQARTRARESISPFSTSSLPSPCDTPVGYIPSSRHLYLGSPVGRLISPTSGFSGPETTSTVPDIEFPAQLSPRIGNFGSSFPAFEPFTSLTVAGSTSGARFQPDAPYLDSRLASTSQGGCGKSSRCMELCRSTDVQGSAEHMCLKYANGDHISAAVVQQSDSEFVLLSAKGDERKSVRPEGSGESIFDGRAKSTRQILCAGAEVGYWNSSGKNGYRLNMACNALRRENSGTAKERQSPAVVMECDKKCSVEGFSNSTEIPADLKVTCNVLPVLELHESFTEEGHGTRLGETHCDSR